MIFLILKVTILFINSRAIEIIGVRPKMLLLTCSLECNGVKGVSNPFTTEDVCYQNLKCKYRESEIS